MFILQSLFCVIGGLLRAAWSVEHTGAWYLGRELTNEGDAAFSMEAFIGYLSWYILLSQMVPISLVVSTEIVSLPF